MLQTCEWRKKKLVILESLFHDLVKFQDDQEQNHNCKRKIIWSKSKTNERKK